MSAHNSPPKGAAPLSSGPGTTPTTAAVSGHNTTVAPTAPSGPDTANTPSGPSDPTTPPNTDTAATPSTLDTTGTTPSPAKATGTTPPTLDTPSLKHRWIWIVTGPTASGKTSTAEALAAYLQFRFVEADEFHSQANIVKMKASIPLTDADRAGWLAKLHNFEKESAPSDLVMTCSALKRRYRDILRLDVPGVIVRFVFLDAPEEELTRRAAERKGHYAGPGLLRSQFEALERPEEDETDVLVVGTVGRGVEGTVEEVRRVVREEMGKKEGWGV